MNFWCLNAHNSSTRCVAIWRKSALLPPRGSNGAYALAAAILEGDSSIPLCVRDALAPIIRELQALNEEIAVSDRAIIELVKTDANARRLMSVPGIGPITASAIAASVQDVGAFSGPREFAAFLGLAPRQNSSGGKERLGRVSKMGNRYLRKLLVVGAHAVLFHRKAHQDGLGVGGEAYGNQTIQACRGASY